MLGKQSLIIIHADEAPQLDVAAVANACGALEPRVINGVLQAKDELNVASSIPKYSALCLKLSQTLWFQPTLTRHSPQTLQEIKHIDHIPQSQKSYQKVA